MTAFTGTWDVVGSPDLDEDYLRMEIKPYVRLIHKGNQVEGEYHIGLQIGEIDGRLEDEGYAIFSFSGVDEMDEVNGAGTARLDGERLVFRLMYHFGDQFIFECERRPSASSEGGAGPAR